MRWTNHPRIFLEVAIVKLCQLEQYLYSRQQPEEWNELKRKVINWKMKLTFKSKWYSIRMSPSATNQKKPQRTSRKGFQAPVGKINEILKQATKQDLSAIKGRWGEIIDQLNCTSNAFTSGFIK